MRLYKIILLLSVFHITLFSNAAEWVNEAPYTSIIIPKMTANHRHWYVRLDGFSSPKPGALVGGGAIFGRQFEILTVDIQAKFLTGTYDNIAPERDLAILDDAASNPISTDVSAEINNRDRLSTTPFSGLIFGPAVGIHSRILQVLSPRFSEMGRCGVYFGSLTDGTSATAFSAIILFAEASILYQLSQDGAWTLAANVSTNAGRMQNDLAPSGVQGRVPVLFGNVGLSLGYWF